MNKGGMLRRGSAAVLALSLALAPAFAASVQQAKNQAPAPKKRSSQMLASASFTPAVADPRLAALFAGRDSGPRNFRFTPAENGSKAMKVAVRARAATAAEARRTADTSASTIAALTPTAYNLGIAVGWKRFALSGDVAKIQGGLLPAGREAAEVGISYSGKKFTGRLQVGAERTDGSQPQVEPPESSYSLDVGGSYSIARNLAVTGGVRYKIQRDRLETLEDSRRDSQAVYIGTAFRF